MQEKKMPSIDINSKNFFFAFRIIYPITTNRFIDESIYIPEIVYVKAKKIDGEFLIVEEKVLEYEKCNVENFGENYPQHFMKDELNNSYCLKIFDTNLTLEGGYKYERMSYIRINLYTCINTTENKNLCKSIEEISYYMSSGYFSMIFKDFDLNPSNYSFPILSKFQDLYRTIDKLIFTDLILNFGVTEVHTDTGLFKEHININKYLMFRKERQNFYFRDEQEYYNERRVLSIQMELDDALVVQKRSYAKLPESLSKIGGYMYLMNTIFLLLTSIINLINSDIKIINSIFSFNLKRNKVILKFESLKNSSIITNPKKQKVLDFSKKQFENSKFNNGDKSNNN